MPGLDHHPLRIDYPTLTPHFSLSLSSSLIHVYPNSRPVHPCRGSRPKRGRHRPEGKSYFSAVLIAPADSQFDNCVRH
jgi:hypothetical protein